MNVDSWLMLFLNTYTHMLLHQLVGHLNRFAGHRPSAEWKQLLVYINIYNIAKAQLNAPDARIVLL